MDSATLMSLAITLIATGIILLVTAVTMVLSFAIPLAIFYVVYKRVQSGEATVVVGGVVGHALAQEAVKAQAVKAQATGPQHVKKTRCSGCGAPKVTRSLSAYVYCDFCGQLIDWDFQACLADKRSRLPGPAYENLLRQTGPELAAAKAADDRDAYREVQRRIWDAYARVCPAALSPRIGDPQFRDRFVAWSADAQTLMDLDPGTQATRAAQDAQVQALQWDRSNPFAPKIQQASFDALLDVVLANQHACNHLLEQHGMLATHPDHPTPDLLTRIGVSALVQGWIPYLPPDHVPQVLDKTGLADEYDVVEPPELREGPCPQCAAPLQVVPDAKRVVCHSCGHMAGVGTGTLPCHGCGTPITLPQGENLVSCPSCQAELRMMRWPASR